MTLWHYKTSGFSYIQTAVGDGWFLFSRHPIFSLSSFFKREKKSCLNMFIPYRLLLMSQYVCVMVLQCRITLKLLTAVFWQKIVTFYDEFHDIFHPKHTRSPFYLLWADCLESDQLGFSGLLENINRWRAFPDTANCVHEKKKSFSVSFLLISISLLLFLI